MIKEHDCIVLTQDISGEGLRAGDVGTVVHIHRDGEAYEAESVGFAEVAAELAGENARGRHGGNPHPVADEEDRILRVPGGGRCVAR